MIYGYLSGVLQIVQDLDTVDEVYGLQLSEIDIRFIEMAFYLQGLSSKYCGMVFRKMNGAYFRDDEI